MTRLRLVPVAAAVVLAATGLTTGSAAAAIDSPFCDPSVSTIGRLVAGDARDGSREPDLGEVHEDLPASAKGKADKRFKATVPVYFHVVTDGSIGAVTDDQIGVRSTSSTTPSPAARAARPPGSRSRWPALPGPTMPTGSTPTPAAPASTR